MTIQLNEPTIAEQYTASLAHLNLEDIPAKAREIAVSDLLDFAGCCLTARQSQYISMLLAGWDGQGGCTALGQTKPLDSAGAALINGTAAHGEDFDDTLEGAPIRVGAMVIPGTLAAGERLGLSGSDVLRGIIIGLETICRANFVAAGKIHKQCFHPVGVIGALGAAMSASATMGLNQKQMTNALGIAASMSSGIIEYLTEGSWTKRLHPGWAAQSGLRAAFLARAGYDGPRTVFDGTHNFFKAFAPTAHPRYEYLTEGVGKQWLMERIVFKPYACGTMIHPYIDCMIRLAEQGADPEQIVDIECKTGEGLVHRLWEPLASKHQPPSGYAAKFSMPWCMAVGFFERDAGLAQFTDEKVKDPRMLDLAAKIHYVIDPENEYPDNYSGHIKVRYRDGSVTEMNQPHMRGGTKEPLTRDQLIAKFRSNVSYGGWPENTGEQLLEFCLGIESKKNLDELKAFRT